MSNLARNTGAILSSKLSGSFTVRVWSPPADEAAERLHEMWQRGQAFLDHEWFGWHKDATIAFYPGRHSPVYIMRWPFVSQSIVTSDIQPKGGL